jgi:hypothetical protein
MTGPKCLVAPVTSSIGAVEVVDAAVT